MQRALEFFGKRRVQVAFHERMLAMYSSEEESVKRQLKLVVTAHCSPEPNASNRNRTPFGPCGSNSEPCQHETREEFKSRAGLCLCLCLAFELQLQLREDSHVVLRQSAINRLHYSC